MNKKDISIFLFAVLTVVFIYKIEFNEIKKNVFLFNVPSSEESYGSILVENNVNPQTYEEAVELAKESGKPIFIYFEADWCGYCKQMKKNVLSNLEVKNKIEENYIKLIVNIDNDKNAKLNFKVKTVPTYLICSADGEIIQKQSGYQDISSFLNWLEPKTTTSLMN